MEMRVMAEREAQQRILQIILPDEELCSEIRMQRSSPDESFGGGESNRW
jgi:hypothetical protein